MQVDVELQFSIFETVHCGDASASDGKVADVLPFPGYDADYFRDLLVEVNMAEHNISLKWFRFELLVVLGVVGGVDVDSWVLESQHRRGLDRCVDPALLDEDRVVLDLLVGTLDMAVRYPFALSAGGPVRCPDPLGAR